MFLKVYQDRKHWWWEIKLFDSGKEHRLACGFESTEEGATFQGLKWKDKNKKTSLCCNSR